MREKRPHATRLNYLRVEDKPPPESTPKSNQYNPSFWASQLPVVREQHINHETSLLTQDAWTCASLQARHSVILEINQCVVVLLLECELWRLFIEKELRDTLLLYISSTTTRQWVCSKLCLR